MSGLAIGPNGAPTSNDVGQAFHGVMILGCGKGVVPGRLDDSFGIGLARTQFSSAFLPFLRQQFNLGLQREDAIEMYYNMAVTPWMNLTSDVQIVDSALNKAISPTTGKLTGIDTVVVAGARLRVRF